MDTKDLIRRAGGPTKIAALTGWSPNTIAYWGVRNRVPAERVPKLETATGIAAHEWRPDLYRAVERAPS